MLTVVIPTYNAEATLAATVDSLRSSSGTTFELVVADGGSADHSRDLALQLGARVVQNPVPNRGAQLALGAAQVETAWLLFWHADTRASADWYTVAQAFMAAPNHHRRAGYFRLVLDDAAAPARRIERLANWRSRTLGLPYGDQGLLISQDFYRHLGGYQSLPLMEDVDLVRRIGRDRLLALPARAVTSAERYRRDGYWRRPLRNLSCLALYSLGVTPRRLIKLYG